MPYFRRCVGLATVILSLAAVLSASEAPGKQAVPTVYFMAPTLGDTPGVSPLPIEAALRAAAVDLAARGTYAAFVPVDQLGTLPSDTWPRIRVKQPGDTGGLFVCLEKPGKEISRASLTRPDVTTWANLAETTTALAGQIADFAAKEFTLPARRATEILAEKERGDLQEVYKRILASGPPAAVKQSPTIDAIMAAHPTSAEALRVACLPSLITLTQDVYGSFSLRDSLLAVPLSYWVAAERIAPASTSTDRLTGAWLAFLCGFPAETKATLDALKSKQTLAAALEMFVTRDWRPVDEAKIASAPYITQVAWVWAVQMCDTGQNSREALHALMNARKDPSLATAYDYQSVELGHVMTAFMPAAFAARDLALLLSPGHLPEGDRLALTAEFAKRFLGRDNAIDKESFLQALSVFNNGLAQDVPDSQGLHALERVYGAAIRLPDGPLHGSPASPDNWQSLSPWTYAQAARGLFETSVELRARFLKKSWGVADRAREFTSRIKAGMASSPSGKLLSGMADMVAEDRAAAGAGITELMHTPLGHQPRTWTLLTGWVDNAWLNRMRRDQDYVWTPVGCWEYESLAATDQGDDKYFDELYAKALERDPYSRLAAARSILRKLPDAQLAPLAARFSYNHTILRGIAWHVANARKPDVAREVLGAIIEADPLSMHHYLYLSNTYKNSGDTDKAIEVLMKGCDTCPWDVGVSNQMGRLAQMLADEGRTEEALRYGKRGSENYSSMGLHGYAYALRRAGKRNEALEGYAKAAERYASCTEEYLENALELGVPAEKVAVEARRLADMHDTQEMIWYVVRPFLKNSQGAYAKEFLDGRYSRANAITRGYLLGVYHLLNNNAAAAKQAFSQAVHSREFLWCRAGCEVNVALWLYYTASLDADEESRRDCRRYIREMEKHFGAWRPVYDYTVTVPSNESSLTTVDRAKGTDFLALILAAEAEAKHDWAKAVELYRKVTDINTRPGDRYLSCAVARSRLAILQPDKAETKAPAE